MRNSNMNLDMHLKDGIHHVQHLKIHIIYSLNTDYCCYHNAADKIAH